MIYKNVVQIPFNFKDDFEAIQEVEKSLALLTYSKPKPRQLVIPGDINELPDTIEGGLVKIKQTPEGVLYSTNNDAPGYQIESSIFYDPYTTNLFHSVFNLIKHKHIKDTEESNLSFYHHGWFFISPPSNTEAFFHNHLRFNDTFPHDVPSYTWVFYLQLPDKTIDKEGWLILSDGKNEYPLDVKLNTIYVFPSNLLHKPNIAPNSTRNRITAAGNILIPGSTKSFI